MKRVENYLFIDKPVPEGFTGVDEAANEAAFNEHSASIKHEQRLRIRRNGVRAVFLGVASLSATAALYYGVLKTDERQDQQMDQIEEDREACVSEIPENLPSLVVEQKMDECASIGVPVADN